MTGSAVRPWRTVMNDCVRTATAAPSLHNSQPWRFRIDSGAVEVYADRSRRLDVLDPSGRELLISVGAAVFTLRLALRRAGLRPESVLFPDGGDPDLVARVTVVGSAAPTPAVEALAETISLRHTNRWPFAGSAVPADTLEHLIDAARKEAAVLNEADAAGRDAVLGLSQQADRLLRAKSGYRAELTRWAGSDAGRRDGVPTWAIGPWDALERLPVRDFGDVLAFPRPSEWFEPHPTILVLATHGDTAVDQVRAGQALQCALLTATRQGIATTPISQPVEIPPVRAKLTGTGSGLCAQIVLRVGYGPPVGATPRRPLEEVLLPDRGRS